MTDIVERISIPLDEYNMLNTETLAQKAEITRLIAEVESMEKLFEGACEVSAAEITRLRADVDRLEKLFEAGGQAVKVIGSECARLRAENERMREALEWYAKTFCEGIENGCGNMTEMDCSGCRARAALTEPKELSNDAEWQPIATAPRDGTRINVCWKPFGGISAHVELGKWSSAKGWCNTYGNPFNGDPDYWMPLPPPPTETSNG